MLQPSRAQRTLTARKKEYTSPTATPPPGTTTMAAMTELLDTLKALPPGTDPESWYRQLGLKSEDMAAVRRWVNSPSVGDDETLHIKDGGNQMVEQTLEMKVSTSRDRPSHLFAARLLCSPCRRSGSRRRTRARASSNAKTANRYYVYSTNASSLIYYT